MQKWINYVACLEIKWGLCNEYLSSGIIFKPEPLHGAPQIWGYVLYYSGGK